MHALIHVHVYRRFILATEKRGKKCRHLFSGMQMNSGARVDVLTGQLLASVYLESCVDVIASVMTIDIGCHHQICCCKMGKPLIDHVQFIEMFTCI